LRKTRKRRFLIVTAAAFLAVWSLAAGVIVCPKCGYEAADSQSRCAHCGAVLPSSQPAAGDEAAAAVRTGRTEPVLEAGAVEQEIEKAREAAAEGRLDLAEYFLRNAAALNTISTDDAGPARGERIVELLEGCRTRGNTVSVKCPACDGTGKSAAGASREAGGVSSLGRCSQCGGKGVIRRRVRPSELRLARGRAIEQYRLIQRNRLYRPVGEAWAPPDVAEDLTGRQRAALKRATAAPCGECGGLGRIDCDECNGTGRIKCPNRECVDGVVHSVRSERFSKGKHTWQSKCKVCDGRGWLACEECGGTGAVLCRECGGSGERALCRRCSGKGLVDCRRCRGSGEYKGAPCAYCGSQGVTECTSCGGDGRSR